MIRAALPLASVLVVATAHADVAPAEPEVAPAVAPDPEAVRAGEEANLASTERRQGIVGGLHVGPSFTIGGGTGTGGTVAFRLGQVATPETVLGIELVGSGQLRRVSVGPMMSELRTNSLGSFLVTAQRFIGPSVWIRFAGGLGVHKCSKCKTDLTDEQRIGPAGAFGAGIDVARFKGLVLSLEVSSVNQVNRDGLVSSNSFALGLSFN